MSYSVLRVRSLNAESQRSARRTFDKQKEELNKIITPVPHLTLTEYVVEEGEQLFSAITKLGLEGIVAKKADSLYVGGRTKDWLKIKTRAAHEQMKKRIETWGR